ncbi:MAG: transcriptional repressor NrdR [Candidatus Omnitrophica bacterium]|nr:transcriptional repressor NrdR [Candidatus Omnitrophota bacterium]
MRCPYCKKTDDKVIDSRSTADGITIRRRRECLGCNRRFTTYERVEEVPLLVIKKDQRRETYDRGKVLSGVQKACEKRPVSREAQDEIVDELEKMLDEKYEKEVSSSAIGEFIMEKLAKLDQVAYVRFASVYRQFKDINHFLKELKGLLSK